MAEDIIVGRSLPAANAAGRSAGQMAFYELLRRLPSGPQVGLIFGLAAALALGVGLIMWSMKPTMVPLFTDLEPRVMLDISEQLRRDNIEFDIDYATRTLLVPGDRAGELKTRLHGIGQTDGYGPGWGSTLDKETAPGTSTDLERARFLYALQNELSRSIADMANIERARVHLAVPKQTAFLRARDKPTASVVIFPTSGRSVPESQVEAIRRLVAAGVTNMLPGSVEVVDQNGRLLTPDDSPEGLGRSFKQLDLKREIEHTYVASIEKVLRPSLGLEGMRVEVHADLDFSRHEVTRETFDADPKKMRSEKVDQQRGGAAAAAIGVPGALTNQPPGAGTTEPGAQADTPSQNDPERPSSTQTIRNWELDKEIRRILEPGVALRKLSIALVVDNQPVTQEDGTVVREPRQAEDLEQIRALVIGAVGFDEKRGDSIQVVNRAFLPPMEIAPPEPKPIWEQPWVWSLVRQLLAGLVVLAALFMIVRPALRSLAGEARRPGRNGAQNSSAGALSGPSGAGGQSREHADGDDNRPESILGSGELLPPPPQIYGDILNLARAMADDDPKRIATVLKDWVANDAS